MSKRPFAVLALEQMDMLSIMKEDYHLQHCHFHTKNPGLIIYRTENSDMMNLLPHQIPICVLEVGYQLL
jgi:hypothetical protein